ncbi:MAG: heat-inducible transcriptional repressor HrcA [Pseudomonadota bacterium]
MAGKQLNDRARHLLGVLIRHYIDAGRPLGSKVLAGHSGLDLSPATIRNVMSELEKRGFIHAPHTSAGRVPTVRGYRFFVETMITADAAEQHLKRQIQQRLAEPASTTEVIEEVSSMLSSLTNFVGVVTVPRRDLFCFHRIEFVPLNDRQVLAIVVLQGGEVQNRVITLNRGYEIRELERAANVFNDEYAGLPFAEIKRRLMDDLVIAQREMDTVMTQAIELAGTALGARASTDVVVSGQNNLIGYDDLSDIDKLKSLFQAFQEKREMLDLLDRCAEADGVQLFIGSESESDAFESCSLVGAPYRVDGEVVGVLGVIGPTRMAYERVISVVDSTARILGSVLQNNP